MSKIEFIARGNKVFPVQLAKNAAIAAKREHIAEIGALAATPDLQLKKIIRFFTHNTAISDDNIIEIATHAAANPKNFNFVINKFLALHNASLYTLKALIPLAQGVEKVSLLGRWMGIVTLDKNKQPITGATRKGNALLRRKAEFIQNKYNRNFSFDELREILPLISSLERPQALAFWMAHPENNCSLRQLNEIANLFTPTTMTHVLEAWFMPIPQQTIVKNRIETEEALKEMQDFLRQNRAEAGPMDFAPDKTSSAKYQEMQRQLMQHYISLQKPIERYRFLVKLLAATSRRAVDIAFVADIARDLEFHPDVIMPQIMIDAAALRPFDSRRCDDLCDFIQSSNYFAIKGSEDGLINREKKKLILHKIAGFVKDFANPFFVVRILHALETKWGANLADHRIADIAVQRFAKQYPLIANMKLFGKMGNETVPCGEALQPYLNSDAYEHYKEIFGGQFKDMTLLHIIALLDIKYKRGAAIHHARDSSFHGLERRSTEFLGVISRAYHKDLVCDNQDTLDNILYTKEQTQQMQQLLQKVKHKGEVFEDDTAQFKVENLCDNLKIALQKIPALDPQYITNYNINFESDGAILPHLRKRANALFKTILRSSKVSYEVMRDFLQIITVQTDAQMFKTTEIQKLCDAFNGRDSRGLIKDKIAYIFTQPEGLEKFRESLFALFDGCSSNVSNVFTDTAYSMALGPVNAKFYQLFHSEIYLKMVNEGRADVIFKSDDPFAIPEIQKLTIQPQGLFIAMKKMFYEKDDRDEAMKQSYPRDEYQKAWEFFAQNPGLLSEEQLRELASNADAIPPDTIANLACYFILTKSAELTKEPGLPEGIQYFPSNVAEKIKVGEITLKEFVDKTLQQLTVADVVAEEQEDAAQARPSSTTARLIKVLPVPLEPRHPNALTINRT